MSYIRAITVKGQAYYQEVESYRNAEGKPRVRVVKHLGKELPAKVGGQPLGYLGCKLQEGKRVWFGPTPIFGSRTVMALSGKAGIIKSIGKKKALVRLDEPVLGTHDWRIHHEYLSTTPNKSIVRLCVGRPRFAKLALGNKSSKGES